jgi:hypothetical protein
MEIWPLPWLVLKESRLRFSLTHPRLGQLETQNNPQLDPKSYSACNKILNVMLYHKIFAPKTKRKTAFMLGMRHQANKSSAPTI